MVAVVVAFVWTLCACVGAVPISQSTQRLSNRQNVLQRARQSLQASPGHKPLSHRKLTRASSDSTFGCFLKGTYASTNRCLQQSNAQPKTRGTAGSINPINFGADPTGVRDSSDAFDLAVAALLRRNTSGHTTGGHGRIVDLGDAQIDLNGGDYLISRPIVIPHGYGNFGIGFGALRAAKNFPSFANGHERYLIEISDLSVPECQLLDKQQKVCNENVNIVDMFFDSSRVAYGGLLINATMGANVGPDIYFLNFMKVGFAINGGHEVNFHEAWLGATYFGAPNHTESEAGSTALQIIGNDHVVQDVVIFGGQIGVYNQGGANIIEGVHTWNDATHANSPGFGIVLSDSPSMRLLNVYLDYTALRIQGPSHCSVTDSFFLGGGTIVLAPSVKFPACSGLMISDNTWSNYNMPHNTTIVIDEREMSFTAPTDMLLWGNVGSTSMIPKAITVRKTKYLTNATQWSFDFTDDLLFPSLPILDVTYSLTADAHSPFVRHNALAPSGPIGQVVVIVTDVPTSGSITVKVTQGLFTTGNGW